MTTTADLDPNSLKYQVACGFHVITGMKVVCIIDIIRTCVNISLIFEKHRWIAILVGALLIAIFLTPIVAIKRREPRLIFPYLIYTVIGMVASLISILTLLGYVFTGYFFIPETMNKILRIAFFEIGIDIIGCAIAFRCYEYLKEIRGTNGGAQMSFNV